MKSIITALTALQEVGNEILSIEKERNEITERLKRLKAMLQSMEQEIHNKRQKLQEAERWFNEKEKEIKEDQEKIKKSQARLNALTKTKEFVAVQREMENFRKANQVKEDELLKLLHAIEEFKSSLKEEGEKLEELQKAITLEEEINEEKIEELNKKLLSFESRKKQAEEHLSPAILNKYHKIQCICNGVAVAEVRKGTCLGCNRQLPPQLYNLLLIGETLENCPFCNRFIHVKV